ncbi:hypothetical protein V7S43_010319 [Phytophthora oleae]|uniref:Transcription factor CBF/NF-Y/archaeal histone domain-containing protein n=1 Tax=Phytophthora oleae TaxID=2107226 RepID=A0ABD3FDS1_9STRA
MAEPAAGKASASGATPAQPATPTSNTVASSEAKTQTQPAVPVPAPSSQQKPQNDAATGTQLACSSSTASTASTDGKTSVKPAETSAKSSAEASAMDQALRAQEEARRLQFALAQQQVQQYQAMTKQLEAQSGITMTPSTSSSTTNSTTATSMAGLAKTSEDLQKLRQEQLARLQQNVQRQAAMAAQAVQKRSNEEWMRNKLLLEQEHLRLLRLHEQQLMQNKGNTVTTATATSIADSLLAQQQQVIRQQQMLREMLQKQQKQQQAQVQLKFQLQTGGDKKPAVTTTVKADSAADYAQKKRKLDSAFYTELEGLARVCIRVANARTDCEMRQALDKMTSWLHRCTEITLLQLAQRDYRDSMAHRRPIMIQQDRWPLDLQVKSEFITQKIVQLLGAFLLREKNKAAQQEAAAKAAAAASAALATAAAATTATSSATGAAKTNASTVPASASPATSSTTTTAPSTSLSVAASTSAGQGSSSSQADVSTTVANTAAAAVGTTSTATPEPPIILAPAVRVPVKRDIPTIERDYAEIKAQLQAKQVETNQKAKAKRDAAKLEVAKAVGAVSNSAMLAASYKRLLQVEIPGSVKKPRTDSYGAASTPVASYRPPTTSVPPISPRVAQQFYDLDLSTRTTTEPEDKMYLPPKLISKIMYRALPGDHEEETEAKGRTPSPAVSPTHSVQDLDSSDSISISDNAVTFMQECVTEFLLYFTSEARDLSIMQNRRTKKGVGLSISGNNVVEGMENLGFTSYAQVLSGYNEKVKASQDAAARKKMERKKLVQQEAMKRAAMAANAARATAMGQSVAVGIKPVVPSPLVRYNVGTSIAQASTTVTTAPARPATVSAPKPPVPAMTSNPQAK